MKCDHRHIINFALSVATERDRSINGRAFHTRNSGKEKFLAKLRIFDKLTSCVLMSEFG